MFDFLKRIFLVIIFLPIFTFSQETTGTLQGTVKDSKNNPIPFVNIVVIDTETNFKYGTITQETGFYILNNLPPSNSYQIAVSSIGFSSKKLGGIAINLGTVTYKDFVLNEENVTLEEVVLSANNSNNRLKQGNEVLLGNKKLNETPTISRGIQDLTKNLPEANLNSFAGASNRFNNLNIDGIANNDIIGFQEPASGASGSQANGTPGSLSRSQPIGFGAIKELSVKIAPFDVSIGNFSGANINVVTKNGTNKFQGELYAFGNNQTLIGSFSDGIKQEVSNFYDTQFGVSIGGALKEDELFYFVNFEQALAKIPVLNAPGTATSNFSLDVVESIADHLINNYNYDPGTFGDAALETSSTKLFARLDYNISDKHKLTIRNNYVKSFTDNLERNASFLNFGNQGYRHNSTANSLAVELKSNLTNNTSNVLSIGYNTVKEGRDFDGRVFPHIQIAVNASDRIFAGTYREASVYGTDFSTVQLSNKFTYIKNNHSFKFGGFAQLNNIDYGFLSAWNGRWEYRSVEDFLNDNPRRVRGVYNVNNNNFDFVSNTPSASFKVFEGALYAQDNFRASDRLSLSFGVRLDAQSLPEDLPISQEVQNTPEFSRFDNKLSKAPQVNPRFGFTYFLDDNRTYKLRGGTGLFSGRLPYLWFAYVEYISGTNYFNIDLRPDGPLPLTENLDDLVVQQPGLTEINLLDTNFKLPREWKSNMAIDISLKNNWNFGLEATYTDIVNGIFFQSINRRNDIGNFVGADDRPYFLQTGDDIKINPNFTNVFLLTNTDQGYRYNITASVNKKLKNYDGYLGYTYGKSKDISSTVRSSPAANFEWNQAVSGNNPSLSFSNFDLRHKIVSSHSFSYNFNDVNNVLVSFLYGGRSGSPFSYVYQGDPNRDGSSRNDLIFVPSNQSEINLIDITDSNDVVITTAQQQWEQLNAFIENDNYLSERRGQFAERNGARTPWNHELDMKLSYNRKLKNGKGITVSLDMLNVLNFVNRDWGRLVFVPNVVNSSFSLLRFVDIQNGTPRYTFNIPEGTTPWVTDAQNSRWRAQLGVKFSF
ncbi:carboxypeptidase regulatory-like domain-containing protein [Spongiivirga sp. MCCC 1A20706]|uniref:TonB-dependent receptor n=1 Tax=Spongiivirga sp. MCCC 1A20706 TaxID=3160963 RepID=UPI0039773F1B